MYGVSELMTAQLGLCSGTSAYDACVTWWWVLLPLCFLPGFTVPKDPSYKCTFKKAYFKKLVLGADHEGANRGGGGYES